MYLSLPLVLPRSASFQLFGIQFNLTLQLMALAMALAKGGQTMALWPTGSQTIALWLMAAAIGSRTIALWLRGKAGERKIT